MSFEAIPLRSPESPRPPLPTRAGEGSGGDVAPDDAVVVTGFMCSRGHFNGPDAAYCSVCGISMVLLTRQAVKGVRPPLGYLVRDDGATFLLDRDYVIGRNPEMDPEVQAGRALPLSIPEADRTMSRCHASVVLDAWTVSVVDRHSANGTFVSGPAATGWLRVEPDAPTRITPGSKILAGGRTFVFDSHFRT